MVKKKQESYKHINWFMPVTVIIIVLLIAILFFMPKELKVCYNEYSTTLYRFKTLSLPEFSLDSEILCEESEHIVISKYKGLGFQKIWVSDFEDIDREYICLVKQKNRVCEIKRLFEED